jgi:hypothetical protein
MKDRGPLPALVGSTLVVAVLITLVVKGGWLIWFPVLAALAVVCAIYSNLSR